MGLRWHQLDRALGGMDENEFLLSWAYSPMERILTQWDNGGHQVFHTFLVRIMILLFGEENEVAIRFPAFIAGIGGLVMIYKTARLLFAEIKVAQVALLAAAVAPIHILYSQTARGYSLIIFFSIVMIYSILRIFQTQRWPLWGFLLVVSGFLSVYTIPTNVYFVFGLAFWVLFVLANPAYRKEWNLDSQQARQWFWGFLALFSTMGMITIGAYWPIWRQVLEAGDSYYASRVGDLSIYALHWHLIRAIFQEPLILFLPFWLIGWFWGQPIRKGFNWLILFIFFTPFGIAWITGLTGFPRNYLFNFPLFAIAFAAGWVQAETFLKNQMQITKKILYTCALALPFAVLFTAYYPSLKTHDGKLYQENIKAYTQPQDLILIAQSKNYLYARSVFQGNLKQILLLNRLTGLKIIAAHSQQIKDYAVSDGVSEVPVFKDLNLADNLIGKEVSENLYLYSLFQKEITGVLSEDFEANASWTPVFGQAMYRLENKHKVTGDSSLYFEANGNLGAGMETRIQEKANFEEPAIMIIIWAGHNAMSAINKNSSLVNPQIVLRENLDSKPYYVRLGKINLVVQSSIKENVQTPSPYIWNVSNLIGIIPPGEFSIHLRILVEKGQPVYYDSLRVFLINASELKNVNN